MSVERRKSGARRQTGDRPPPPRRSPRPGWDGRRRRKDCAFRGFRRGPLRAGRLAESRDNVRAKVFSSGGERLEFDANYLRRVNL
jgi:hypothetical protein